MTTRCCLTMLLLFGVRSWAGGVAEVESEAAAVRREGAVPAVPCAYGKIEILRDEWGIPHVFADTDEGAMYGLGYATAEERGFQMTYARRIMQGRLAETIGRRAHTSRRETAYDLDR
ncbi:MAG: penicillin acylase family protein, partial [Verrucomicrobia bacterium]|nr:penicillin acylase family protein [Verrucomicrobiota bacterium]